MNDETKPVSGQARASLVGSTGGCGGHWAGTPLPFDGVLDEDPMDEFRELVRPEPDIEL